MTLSRPAIACAMALLGLACPDWLPTVRGGEPAHPPPLLPVPSARQSEQRGTATNGFHPELSETSGTNGFHPELSETRSFPSSFWTGEGRTGAPRPTLPQSGGSRFLDRQVVPAQTTIPPAPPALIFPGTPGAPEFRGAPPPAVLSPDQEAVATPPGSPPPPTPLLLNRALGCDDSEVRVFGWIQNSFTGNTNGTPRDGSNFSVFPNYLANRWMGNQYYLAIEDPLAFSERVNVGFRFDLLFGHDWLFTKEYGLFDNAFNFGQFTGLDLPQIYAEVHLPILTEGGVDLRAGRFFSLTGFESPQAVARPLLSAPYVLTYSPFTFFGALASVHLNERTNVYSGSIVGFDRWPNKPYKWGYLGAFSWTSRDRKFSFVVGGAAAYAQLPRFPPADATYVPVGVPPPPFLAGRRNPFYNQSLRGYVVSVLTYHWTERLTQAVEVDAVWDPKILGFGNSPLTPNSAAYYGFANWFLYQFQEKVTGVWRSELFWDPYGLATGVADVYHEITLGLNVRPKEWLWIRPEARYDWSQYATPFSDGTRSSQLTLAFDIIVLF